MQTPVGDPVSLFLILGQRKQGDRWVKLDESLRSHRPSMRKHLQKLDGKTLCRTVLASISPLRSLTSAARRVLAVLRHIRSSARNSLRVQRTTLAGRRGIGAFQTVFGAAVLHKMLRDGPRMSDTRPSIIRPRLAESTLIVSTTLTEPGFSPCI